MERPVRSEAAAEVEAPPAGPSTPPGSFSDVADASQEFFAVEREVGRLRTFVARVAPPLFFFILFFVAWQIWVTSTTSSVAIFIPAPSDIYGELTSNFSFYPKHTWLTLARAMVGLGVSGVIALISAVIMAHSRFFERMLLPFFVMIKVTPIVALAPALVVALGVGNLPIVIIVVLITFFPFLINAIIGFRAVDPATLELMQSVKASRSEIFWKLRVPHSLPYLFAALKLSVSLSMIGAVVAEWSGAFDGLGTVIILSASLLQMEQLYSAIAVLVILGVALTALVGFLEVRVLHWHESQSVS